MVYIDLPKRIHYWRVCRRFLTSPVSKPVGWPEQSPMLRSTLSSLANLRNAEKLWNPAFLEQLRALPSETCVYHIRSGAEYRQVLSRMSTGFPSTNSSPPGNREIPDK